MNKFFLIATFIAVVISVSAQTTAEEYDYLTKGYKEDIAKGKGIKKGYELKEIRSLTYNGSFAVLKALYRIKEKEKDKAAYLITYKNTTSDTEYLCYPNPKSDSILIIKYKAQYFDKTNTDILRRNIIFYGFNSLINWIKDWLGKDNSGNYEAQFFGTQKTWERFLQMNLIASTPKDNHATPGNYCVNVSFSVDSIGKLHEVIADNNPGYGTAEEAIRVINNSPDWFPASIGRKSVNSKIKRTINFFVKGDTSNFDKVFTSVQIEAAFPGGKEAWKDYLENNLKCDIPYKLGAPARSYSVLVNFLVDRDGNISDVQADPSPYGTREEAIRVIKSSPTWTPATQNGRIVKYRAKQIITFVVSR